MPRPRVILSERAYTRINTEVKRNKRHRRRGLKREARWHSRGGNGGGTFAIGHAVAGSVDCPNGLLEIDTTSATWIPSSCGAAPGADSYGIITVEDRLGWFSTKWTGRAAAPYPNQTDIENAVYLRVSYGFENADGYGCDGIWWLDFPVIPPECPTGS